MHLDLILKLIQLIIKTGKRMKIGLFDKVHSTGFKELFKAIKEFRDIILTVFNKRSSQAIGDAKFPVVFSNQFK
jgi:hypothetical protein